MSHPSRGVLRDTIPQGSPNTLFGVGGVNPVLSRTISICDASARSSIHTSQLRLAAHACVRNFWDDGTRRIRKKKERKEGGMGWWWVDVVRASFEVLRS